MRSLGIDIGSASIKIVEVVQTTKSVVVQRFDEFPLGQNPGHDPAIEILEILREIARRFPSDNIRIVLGLRQEMVAVRNKIFPFADRSKIQKSLAFELEEDLPFSIENAIYDAKIVKTMGNSAEVLACAVPKNRIQDLVNIMNDAQLDVAVLSVEGLALANIWERWNEVPIHQDKNNVSSPLPTENDVPPQRQLQIVLELGHTHSLICAFEEQRLVAVRSLFWGGKNIADSLVKKYEVPYIEALNILQTKAFILLSQEGSSYDHIVFSQSITDAVADLVRDVQISLLEFQSEFNAQILGVSLLGGVSRVKNLHAHLTQQLELPVNTVKSISGRMPAHFDVSTQIDASAGVALGLAIEGLKKPRNPALNFLKNEFQKQNHRYQILWEQWGSTAKIAALIFVGFTIYAMVRDQVASNLVDKSTEALKAQAKAVAHLSPKQANENGIKKFIKEQRARSKDLKAIQNLARMNSALDILRKISDAAPSKNSSQIVVHRLDIDNQKVEVEGYVKQAADRDRLKAALSSLALGGKVESAPSKLNALPPSGASKFAFSFAVDRGITTTVKK